VGSDDRKVGPKEAGAVNTKVGGREGDTQRRSQGKGEVPAIIKDATEPAQRR